MKKFNLVDMVRGWFIGDFQPSALRVEGVEVAIKQFKQGETEPPHFHIVATEVTVVLKGVVRMQDERLEVGDIFVAEPRDVVKFEALEDCQLVVVKVPSSLNDKYEVSAGD